MTSGQPSAVTPKINGDEDVPKPRHFPALDGLRFVFAFWVLMSHMHVIPLFSVFGTRPWAVLLSKAWNTVAFGTAAVIGFFVVSGFCIHLPMKNLEHVNWRNYFLRRFSRILVPLVAALILLRLTSGGFELLGRNSVLWTWITWSLFCEEVYYALYPLVLRARQRWGWRWIIASAFLLSGTLLIWKRGAMYWIDLGALPTAGVLYPVWLLGCVLAEKASQPLVIPSSSLWGWRGVVWAASVACGLAHFRLGISFTRTMVPFGILCFFWIHRELGRTSEKATARALASAGAWSYSLYLVHGPAGELAARLTGGPADRSISGWLFHLAFVLTFSYVFFRLVERPSHRFARRWVVSPPAKAPSVTVRRDVLVS